MAVFLRLIIALLGGLVAVAMLLVFLTFLLEQW
jgi:hypothetical protein